MPTRDYRDILGGGVLVVIGALTLIHTLTALNVGTISRMGPGMFPAALGVILIVFGALIVVPALFRHGAMPQLRIWSPLFVLSGVAAFALTIRPFGLMPAILAVVVISSFAELKVRPVSIAALCAVLCLIAWLTFRVGLGLPIAMIRWPF